MQKFLLLSIILLFVFQAQSQVCLDSSIVIERQSQLDSFRILYPDCNIIPGTLRLQNSDITNLDSLNHLIEVKERLEIVVCHELTSLAGLGNLQTISLFILTGNRKLLDLAELTSLDSLRALNFSNNRDLQSLTGLENIKYCEGININNNYKLKNYQGLENLIGVHGNFFNGRCTGVTSISMPSLKWVTGTLRFDIYSSLENLNGLETLESCRIFAITQSSILNNIQSIENLDAFDISILENPSLEVCHIDNVCEKINTNLNRIHINDNGVGCDSVDVVEAACLSTSLKNISDSNLISVFPNPSNGIVNLNHGDLDIRKIIVYNSLGQKVHLQNEYSAIDLSSFHSGQYYIEIITAKERFIKKLILE